MSFSAADFSFISASLAACFAAKFLLASNGDIELAFFLALDATRSSIAFVLPFLVALASVLLMLALSASFSLDNSDILFAVRAVGLSWRRIFNSLVFLENLSRMFAFLASFENAGLFFRALNADARSPFNFPPNFSISGRALLIAGRTNFAAFPIPLRTVPRTPSIRISLSFGSRLSRNPRMSSSDIPFIASVSSAASPSHGFWTLSP